MHNPHIPLCKIEELEDGPRRLIDGLLLGYESIRSQYPHWSDEEYLKVTHLLVDTGLLKIRVSEDGQSYTITPTVIPLVGVKPEA